MFREYVIIDHIEVTFGSTIERICKQKLQSLIAPVSITDI